MFNGLSLSLVMNNNICISRHVIYFFLNNTIIVFPILLAKRDTLLLYDRFDDDDSKNDDIKLYQKDYSFCHSCSCRSVASFVTTSNDFKRQTVLKGIPALFFAGAQQ